MAFDRIRSLACQYYNCNLVLELAEQNKFRLDEQIRCIEEEIQENTAEKNRLTDELLDRIVDELKAGRLFTTPDKNGLAEIYVQRGPFVVAVKPRPDAKERSEVAVMRFCDIDEKTRDNLAMCGTGPVLKRVKA